MVKKGKLFIPCIALLLVMTGCSNNGSANDTGDVSIDSIFLPQETDDIDDHYFSGVYYMARHETQGGWTPHGHLTNYFIEFFDDGTAMWWSDGEYNEMYFYSGTYSYNEKRDIYSLNIDGIRTLTVSKEDDYLILLGNRFDEERFDKSEYDNIKDAVHNRGELNDELEKLDKIGIVNSKGQKISY